MQEGVRLGVARPAALATQQPGGTGVQPLLIYFDFGPPTPQAGLVHIGVRETSERPVANLMMVYTIRAGLSGTALSPWDRHRRIKAPPAATPGTPE